ncbi:MAG: radical SAM protein [Myxococcaceae bacterium]|jgi:cyclic pyranopterin phosphate synthase|nr:radical SAM protein [Myxococcaceae bacterium]
MHTVGTLRVNLLEQCQLRCQYCLPGTLKPFTSARHRLSVTDYARIATCFRGLGLRKVRFTGGEPLLHPQLTEIVAAFRDALPEVRLAVTTNGLRLAERLDELIAAGLRGATVHLDSLDAGRYRELMGEGDPARALEAVVQARGRLDTVKINCVVQRDRNVDELWSFLELSRELGTEVRFIELMNTGSAVVYTRKAFVSGAEIIRRLSEREPVTHLPRRHPADPSALYRTASGITFGVIASDTAPFCSDCDRLRLTPDGRLRGCLYEAGGLPLADVLRHATNAAGAALVTQALRIKRSHHPLTLVERVPFSMSEAGG